MSLLRIRVLAISFLIALVSAGSDSNPAFAHATLGSSDPPANEIISRSPGRVELRFTEPIEEAYTKVILVDQYGAEVAGTSVQFDQSDQSVLRLRIPDDLARGTYSVVWRTLSAADGHRFSGYFAFTIGSTADVQTVIPPTFSTDAGPPFWLNGLSRWFSFLTLALLAGLWVGWLSIVRPGLKPVWQIGPAVTDRVRRYALLAGLAYLTASIIALMVQVSGQTEDGWLTSFADTLSDTRWGQFWVLRLIFGGSILIGFVIAPWWWPKRRPVRAALLIGLAGLLPLPHAMISHASAQRHGRAEAIIGDYIHLLAMSIWVGGLVLLIVTLSASSELLPIGRRTYLSKVLPRFSTLAICSVAVLAASGLYSAYLQVGSLDGLFDTRYGQTLIYKLIALVVVLVAAAVNLAIISRYVARIAIGSVPSWWRRFAGLAGIEIAGMIVVILFAGRMTGMEPSRAILAERDNQTEIGLVLNGRSSTLTLAPGSSGPNHFRLDVGGTGLDPDVTASILLTPPQDMAGQKVVKLERTAGNAFEAHSAAMSVTGDWTYTVTLSKIGAFQWSADLVVPAGVRQPQGSSISQPSWTFDTTGLTGFAIGMLGVAGLLYGWRSTNRSTRREGLGLGSLALVVGTVLLFQGRLDVAATGIPLDTANPVPVTDQAVEVGKVSFQNNCVACHGVGARGDGPAAGSMNPPPANLLEGHAVYHFDAEFFNWIKGGKPGTVMPAFGQSLTDEQIWSTIIYIRSLQQMEAGSSGSPVATPIPSLVATPVP